MPNSLRERISADKVAKLNRTVTCPQYKHRLCTPTTYVGSGDGTPVVCWALDISYTDGGAGLNSL